MTDYPIRLADQLGEHLRSLRKLRGLTQAELGRRIGVGQARMGEIERNVAAVSLGQLLEILAALDSSLLLRATTQADSSSAPQTFDEARLSSSKAEKPAGNEKPIHVKIPARKGSW